MHNKTFQQKFIVCFLAGALGAYAIFEVNRKIFSEWIPVINNICLLFFLSSIAFVFVWHYKEKRQQINSSSVLAFCQGVIRYMIAIDLSMFAWRKIFLLQFDAPQALLDKPFSSLTGEQATIAYFAYSYPFALCVAALQLGGSFLLLFKKTRLLGVFILMPVVANIILIDIFYDIEVGVLFMAMALMLGLIYLLLCDYDKLVELFFPAKSNLPSFNFRNSLLKNFIRFSAVLIPMVIAALLYDFPNRHPDLTGKFKVGGLVINRNNIDLSSCKDSVLTLVYFDDNNDMVFEYNGQNHWQVGHFNFDKSSRALKTVWRYPKNQHDTLFASLSKIDPSNKMTLAGTMGKDTLLVDLVKVK